MLASCSTLPCSALLDAVGFEASVLFPPVLAQHADVVGFGGRRLVGRTIDDLVVDWQVSTRERLLRIYRFIPVRTIEYIYIYCHILVGDKRRKSVKEWK